MSCTALRTFTISASGVITPTAPPQAGVEARPGMGGMVGCIHGVCSTAGVLNLYDGVNDQGRLVVALPLAQGVVQIEPPGYWRFAHGIYAQFASSLAGNLAISLI